MSRPTSGEAPIQLYDFTLSGNAYKVRLLLNKLNLPCEIIPVKLLEGEAQKPEFRRLNPMGKVPYLVLDDGRGLAESNAILLYLAEDTPFLPRDPFERARVHQWLFWEQNTHEPALAVARFLARFSADPERHEQRLRDCRERGHEALAVMNGALQNSPFLCGAHASVADFALYAYTHVAEEGGISLQPFTAVQDWLQRVADLPGHIPMETPR